MGGSEDTAQTVVVDKTGDSREETPAYNAHHLLYGCPFGRGSTYNVGCPSLKTKVPL